MFICKVFLKSVFPYTSKTPIYKYTNISPEFGLQTLKTWIKKKSETYSEKLFTRIHYYLDEYFHKKIRETAMGTKCCQTTEF